MSLANARAAIATGLKNGYSGDPPIFAENTQTPETATQSKEWVRWSVRLASAYDADVSAIFERVNGLLYFQHFHAEGFGTKEAYDFADKVGAIFNSKTFPHPSPAVGLVIFERALCTFAGETGGWSQHNITIPFRSEAKALNAA
jgi:hypothetical protein